MTRSDTKTRISDVRTVGIPVADQDRALEFYVGKLGFETRMDAAYGEGERWIEVAPPGATTSVALVRATESDPPGKETGIRFKTADAAADHAALREIGADVDAEVIPYPVPMFVLRDPDGNALVVVEEPQEG